jgi:hypothetical protein
MTPKVDTGNFASAFFRTLGRDIAILFSVPLAVIIGTLGTGLFTAAVWLGIPYMEAMAKDKSGEDDEDDFEIEFTPGALVKLGVKMEKKDIPEKIIVQETRAEEETVESTVTTDEKAAPKTEPEKEQDKPKKLDKPTKPTEQKDKKLPTSKNPTTKNTPYNDLPTVDVNEGDPFGDPGGWADMAKDGDPWATAVMKALNNMEVGAYAAKAKGGDYKFQLKLCKDGTIKEVISKGGSAPPDLQNGVLLALQALELPKPPAKVAKQMPSNCAKIKYTFVWSAKGVK